MEYGLWIWNMEFPPPEGVSVPAVPWAQTNPHAQPKTRLQDLIPTHSPNKLQVGAQLALGWDVSCAILLWFTVGINSRMGLFFLAWWSLAAAFSLGQLQTCCWVQLGWEHTELSLRCRAELPCQEKLPRSCCCSDNSRSIPGPCRGGESSGLAPPAALRV